MAWHQWRAEAGLSYRHSTAALAQVNSLREWFPAVSGMACLGLGAGLIGIYGFFVEPLSREYGASVAALNIGPVFLLLVPGIFGPLVGRLVDRLSIRLIMLAGATLAMLSLLSISQVSSLLASAVLFALFSLGLALYGPVVVNGMLVKLYPGREARALAIAAMGISVASITLPPLVGLLLENMDWRPALAGLAAALLLMLWLMVLAGVPATSGVAAAASGGGLAEPAIYRSRNFWLIGCCVAMGFNVIILLALCYPPHFISQGYSASQAGLFVAVSGVSGMVGKLLLAVMADRLRDHVRLLAVGVLLLQCAGLLLLLAAGSTAAIVPAMALLGFGSGAFIPMHPYLNSRYFDVRVIGEVNGAQMPLFLPLGLVGPPLAGYVFDSSGSYLPVLAVLAALLGVAVVFALLLPAPTQPAIAAH